MSKTSNLKQLSYFLVELLNNTLWLFDLFFSNSFVITTSSMTRVASATVVESSGEEYIGFERVYEVA